MATRACPCGYRGHPQRACICTEGEVARYASRLSGPLLDRVDLTVRVGPVPPVELGAGGGEASAPVLARVLAARGRQADRTGRLLNGDLRGQQVMQAARPVERAAAVLRRASERLGLSARSHHRVLAVARTIADLEGDPVVEARHVAEALQFRG